MACEIIRNGGSDDERKSISPLQALATWTNERFSVRAPVWRRNACEPDDVSVGARGYERIDVALLAIPHGNQTTSSGRGSADRFSGSVSRVEEVSLGSPLNAR
jgi:hypothetical protein